MVAKGVTRNGEVTVLTRQTSLLHCAYSIAEVGFPSQSHSSKVKQLYISVVVAGTHTSLCVIE